MGSRVCVEPLAGAEVGDVESPGATEAGHWLVPVATTEANMRSPWKGLHSGKKEGLFPCPSLAASRKPSQGMREHWTSRLHLEVSFLKNR